MRSTDGGTTWTKLGLASQHLRSIALDPADPNVVIASGYEGGLFRTTTAGSTGTFAAVAGAPTRVEELRFIGGGLYAAGSSRHGRLGRRRQHLAGAGGAAQQRRAVDIDRRPSGLRVDVPDRRFRVGRRRLGDRVVGRRRHVDVAGNRSSAIHTTIGDGTGDRWWLAGQPAYMLGGADTRPRWWLMPARRAAAAAPRICT